MCDQNDSCQPCIPQVMIYQPTQPRKPGNTTMSEAEMERKRYSNFYNNYNIDYHYQGQSGQIPPIKKKWCESYEINRNKKNIETDKGCPTGFKPCTMKMMPPPCGNDLSAWIGEVQPCPPKPKNKNSALYIPGPCTKPCCKHWKPKQPPCIYDKPCKAHCYNSPVSMRAVWHEFI